MWPYRSIQIGLCVLATLLSGCAAFRGAPNSPFQDTEASLAQLEQLYSGDEVASCLRKPLATPDGADQQRECRDRIVQALMLGIDARYAEFEIALLNDTRTTSTLAAAIGLGLNAAGAVSPAGSARALAAAAAGVAGLRERADSELLLRSTVTALQTAMQARRAELRLNIVTGLGQNSSVYPLGFALSDVLGYFRAGTLVGATIGVADAVSQRLRVARDRADRRLGLPVGSEPAAPAGSGPKAPVANPPRSADPPSQAAAPPMANTPSMLRLRACLGRDVPGERSMQVRHLIETTLNPPTAMTAAQFVQLRAGRTAEDERRRNQVLAAPGMETLCPPLPAPASPPLMEPTR